MICTHMHPDHIGQAGWLCDRWRVPLYMSFGEYMSSRCFGSLATSEMSWTAEQHFIRAGVPRDYLNQMAKKLRGFGSFIEPLPTAFRRLQEGDVLPIGGRQWRVMIGSGHSPEHVCLFSESDKMLLSGDQIIPRISSNISVMPSEPDANPLANWFDSLQRFRRDLPADTLVLPAHNKPFTGVHQRLEELQSHHEGHLAAIEKACETPKSAVDLFPVMFDRKIEMAQMPLALGESIAHLHYLLAAGRVERKLDAAGVQRYTSIDPANCPFKGRYRREALPLEV